MRSTTLRILVAATLVFSVPASVGFAIIELTKCFEYLRVPELEDHTPGRERLVDLEKNRGIDPYADLLAIVKKHLRSYQRPYWLVVYDKVARGYFPRRWRLS